MIETNMRRAVIKLLRPLHAVSVENGACHPGTPDVNCTLGWLELKSTERWPAGASTPVRLDHDLTPQQRIWLWRRHAAGGAAWVLLTVGRDWLLFAGPVAAQHLGTSTRDQLQRLAIETWNRTPTSEELIECLSRPQN